MAQPPIRAAMLRANCGTGRRIPTSPASATPPHWPSSNGRQKGRLPTAIGTQPAGRLGRETGVEPGAPIVPSVPERVKANHAIAAAGWFLHPEQPVSGAPSAHPRRVDANRYDQSPCVEDRDSLESSPHFAFPFKSEMARHRQTIARRDVNHWQ
jgi:hypothetical protein